MPECLDVGNCRCSCPMCYGRVMHCYSHNLRCHKGSSCVPSVPHIEEMELEKEKELYRTRVVQMRWRGGPQSWDSSYFFSWGNLIVSNRRIVFRWDGGETSQYLLVQITSIK